MTLEQYWSEMTTISMTSDIGYAGQFEFFAQSKINSTVDITKLLPYNEPAINITSFEDFVNKQLDDQYVLSLIHRY